MCNSGTESLHLETQSFFSVQRNDKNKQQIEPLRCCGQQKKPVFFSFSLC